jgi:thioredoxin reductase (NADPH)
MSDQDAPHELLSRRHQMFPVLVPTDIARVRRFAVSQRHDPGELLVAAGQASPGMFVVIDGLLTVSQRDGLGHVVPIVKFGPGGFLGEVGTLSGGPRWSTHAPRAASRRCSSPRHSCAR